jgi:DNA-binding SARP family transcriptional activator
VAVDYRILGPLEVRHHGRVLTISARKQRMVLAILLAHANQAITIGTLVDHLWDTEPPPNAAVAVRNYVSRVRKILPEPVLLTMDSGYLIHVGAEELDTACFNQLVTRARTVQANHPTEAAELLVAALDLWHGPALVDVANTSLWHSEAPRLEEMRMTAIEDLLDLKLRLGQHADLLAELHRLTRIHPLRERLVAQYMLALRGAGRRAEALQVYHRTRHTLTEELGLEPSEGLRCAHHRVLTDNRSSWATP